MFLSEGLYYLRFKSRNSLCPFYEILRSLSYIEESPTVISQSSSLYAHSGPHRHCRSTMSTSSSESDWQHLLINEFFEVKIPSRHPESTVTQAQCFQVARQILQVLDIKHVGIQGQYSFTLFSPIRSKIIQFRLDSLDDNLLALVHQVYEHESPKVERYQGPISFPLPIYISDLAKGVYLPAIEHPALVKPFPIETQLRTVIDLARFIARATHFPQPPGMCLPDSWTASAPLFLDQLIHTFATHAPDLSPIVERTRSDLHLLDMLPIVLTHTGLGIGNIFVDRDDGHITAVIDWDHAGLEVFGLSVWTLYECFLSYKQWDEIHFYTNIVSDGRPAHQVLEEAFWNEIWLSVSDRIDRKKHEEAVKAAVTLWILNRYFRGSETTFDINNEEHASELARARAIFEYMEKSKETASLNT
ncbi:hypothetical protein ANO11243_084400 [Dothideomycetidae sp. 11243]|nr:hypothetical protein ANO11243_084400 [fungal sp. No.11243]